MVENKNTFPENPQGCREDLRDALTDLDLQKVGSEGGAGPEGARAAYRVALSLGRCRLFGVNPGDELDGILPPHLAVAATAELAQLLSGRSEDAATLSERWDRTVDPAEADNLCAGLLGSRMEAWAVDIMVDEALQDAEEEGDHRAAGLAEGIDRMRVP
jgi:hypothetical protein